MGLSMLSGAAALVLAAWAGHLVPIMLGLGDGLAGVNTAPDARVIVFTLAVSVAVGLCIWLASALALTRRRALPLLTGVSRATGRGVGPGLRHLLVVLQVSLSLALVCTSTLLGRSLWNVLSTDPGLHADRLVGFSVESRSHRVRARAPGPVHGDVGGSGRGHSRRVAGGAASALPLSGGGSLARVEGPRQRAASAEGPFVETVNVSADYFATIGLPIVAGRAFDARDGTSAARVAIVNETLARLIAAQPAVVGETIGFDGGPPDVQIVGVARDARGRSLKVPSEPTVFRPLAQAGGYGAVSVLLRSETPRAISAMAAADLVRRIDPGVAIREFGRLDGAGAERAAARADAGGTLAGVRRPVGAPGRDGAVRRRQLQRHQPDARDWHTPGAGRVARHRREDGPARGRVARGSGGRARLRAVHGGQPRPRFDVVRGVPRRPADHRRRRRRLGSDDDDGRAPARPPRRARRSRGDVATRIEERIGGRHPEGESQAGNSQRSSRSLPGRSHLRCAGATGVVQSKEKPREGGLLIRRDHTDG